MYRGTFLKSIIKYRRLYFLLVPGIIFFAVFKYIPIFALHIAFMDYNMYGPSASTFIGFGQFTWPSARLDKRPVATIQYVKMGAG
jgi:putative aldouronate transport system permease protein